MLPTVTRAGFRLFAVGLAGLLLVSPAICSAEAPDSAAEPVLHVVPQAHIDLAWWWRYDPETTHVIVPKTLRLAFDNLEKHPDYTFTFLQVPAIEPLETLYPELFYKLRYYLYHSDPIGLRIPNPHGTDTDEGRFKIVHGLWCETDGCVPGGESIVRQCLYGKRYYRYKFGIDVKTAWFQDAWTHPWTYPQILKKAGITSYMFKRGRAGENDERLFWWQSPDGSRVLAYKPASFGGVPSFERWQRELNEVRNRYDVNNYIALVGVGDHGGGAPEGDIEVFRENMSRIRPGAKFSTAQRFLKAVVREKAEFPVISDEISPTLRGAYTTAGEIKTGNRKSEVLLLTLEKFASIAARLGSFTYPAERIRKCWEKVMLNQFHDTISGTDTPDATADALRLYQEVEREGRTLLAAVLRAIVGRIQTHSAAGGRSLVVLNPLSWSRDGVVEAELTFEREIGDIQVTDPTAAACAHQVMERGWRDGKYFVRFLLAARSVPSMGYKTFQVTAGSGPESETPLKSSPTCLENEFFRVSLDPASGCVTAIFDKKSQREVLAKSARGNLVQIIEDFGDSEGFLRSEDGKRDPHHRWTGKTIDVASQASIALRESGPVRVSIEIRRKEQLSRFTQRISLYQGIPRIDFELVVNWKGKNRMVKVAFPIAVDAQEATYEIPYGTIRRPNLGEEENAQKWVDLSGGGYGVALINDSRYGYDVNHNVVRLSILRSPDAPALATDEAGTHRVRYSLFPHADGWMQAGVMRRGYEFNYPLLTCVADGSGGDLPAAWSFLEVQPENIIVETLKKAEDSEDLILRLYETRGEGSNATLQWALPVDAVHETDLMETDLADVPVDKGHIELPVSAYSIESLKLIKDQ